MDAIARDVLGNLIVPEVLIDVDKAAAEVGVARFTPLALHVGSRAIARAAKARAKVLAHDCKHLAAECRRRRAVPREAVDLGGAVASG